MRMAVLSDRKLVKQYLYQHIVQNSPISKEIEMPYLATISQQINLKTGFIRNVKQACILNMINDNKIELRCAGQVFQLDDMPISLVNWLVKKNEVMTGEQLISMANKEGCSLDWDDMEKVILVLIHHGVLIFSNSKV